MTTNISSEKQATLDQFLVSPLCAAIIERMVANPEMTAEQAGQDSLARWWEMLSRKDEPMKAAVSGLSAATYTGAKKAGISDERRSQQAAQIADHAAATPEHAYLRGTACPVRINCRNAA